MSRRLNRGKVCCRTKWYNIAGYRAGLAGLKPRRLSRSIKGQAAKTTFQTTVGRDLDQIVEINLRASCRWMLETVQPGFGCKTKAMSFGCWALTNSFIKLWRGGVSNWKDASKSCTRSRRPA